MEEPNIVEPLSCAIRGRNADDPSDRTTGIPTEQRLEIGGEVANCLTSVQKDSMVVEPVIIQNAHGFNKGGVFNGVAPTVTSSAWQDNNHLVEPSIIGYTRDDKGNVTSRHEKEIAGTLHTSTGSGGNTDQFVKEQVIGSMQANAMRGSIDGVSPCLTEAMGMGGGQIPMVTVARQDNIAYKRMPNGNIRAFDASTPDKRGISELQIVNPDNECPTITTAHEPKVLLRYRIRKLTERECFRLMDVSDSDIDKIEAHRIKVTLKNGTVKEKPIPKSAKYKLAGNSIVVSCLYHIFHQMFIAEPPKPKEKQLSLFDS